MVAAAGGIEVQLRGDSNQLQKSIDDALSGFRKFTAQQTQLQEALKNSAAVSKLSAKELDELKKQAGLATSETKKLGASMAEVSQSAGSAGIATTKNMNQAKERIEKVVSATNSISTAFGTAGGAVGKFGSAFGNIFGAAAGGGLIGVGLALVGVVGGKLIEAYQSSSKAAEESAAKQKTYFDEITKKANEARDAVAAASKGSTAGEMDAIREIGKVKAELTLAQKELADVSLKHFGRTTASERFLSAKESSSDGTKVDDVRKAMAEVGRLEASLSALTSTMADTKSLARQLAQDDADNRRLDDAIDAANRKEQALQDEFKRRRDLQLAPWASTQPIMSAAEMSQVAPLDAGDIMLIIDDLTAAELDAINGLVGFNDAMRKSEEITLDYSDKTKRGFDRLVGVIDDTARHGFKFENIESFQRFVGEMADGISEFVDKLSSELGKIDVAGVASSVATGGAAGGGAAIGAAVGGAVDVATGGATMGLGTVIGTLLGSVLGKLLDKLVDVIGVFTPIFDALATVIGAFQPTLIVFRAILEVFGKMIEKSMAGPLLALVKPIAAIMLVFLRLFEAMAPFVYIVLDVINALLFLTDFITAGVKWLDDRFFQPMVKAAEFLYNAFIDIVNGLTQMLRDFTGLNNFGAMLEKLDVTVTTLVDDFPSTMDELNDFMEENKESQDENTSAVKDNTQKYNDELTNVPTGYKIAASIFGAADSELAHAGYGGGQNGAGGTTINIMEWFSSGDMREDMQRLKKTAARGTFNAIGGRRSFPDKRN